jgi:hypothetical protein
VNGILPGLEVHMVVVTPYEIIPNITANKKYVIEDIRGNMIKIRNDFGELSWQMGIEFIEADVYFSICLLQTFNRILNLSSNPLYSLDK